MESERPAGLSEVDLEEFNLMVEEQAFPFEEKAIQVHEKNIELLSAGLFSTWIDRSIEKLATLLPARYAKPEESIQYIASIDGYSYSAPRFLRDDASTGFIADLDRFTYAWKKTPDNPQILQTTGDIESNSSLDQDDGDSKSAEHTPVAEEVLSEGARPENMVANESGDLRQTPANEQETGAAMDVEPLTPQL
jgi:hypothetical protein